MRTLQNKLTDAEKRNLTLEMGKLWQSIYGPEELQVAMKEAEKEKVLSRIMTIQTQLKKDKLKCQKTLRRIS